MTKFITIFFSLFLSGLCVGQQEELGYYKSDWYRISLGGCSTRDSLSFTRVAEHLYTDENKRLYFLSFECEDEGRPCQPMFIARTENDCDPEKRHDPGKKFELSRTIDLASFRFLGYGYYADKNYVYNYYTSSDGGHLLAWKHTFRFKKYTVDYGCYTAIEANFFIDMGYGLHYDSEGNLYFLTYAESAKTGKEYPVFHRRFGPDCTDYNVTCDSTCDISGVIDLPTFRRYDDGYYRDQYRKYEFVDGIDGGYLAILHDDSSDFTYLFDNYFLGADGYVYLSTLALGSNGPEPYFRKLPLVDAATFYSFGEYRHAKDKNHVYYCQGAYAGVNLVILEGADVASFEQINGKWAKDAQHVYYDEQLLQGLNPDSVTLFMPYTVWEDDQGPYYHMIKDNDQVFYRSREVVGVDATTFEWTGNVYRDKNWIYDRRYFANPDPEFRTPRQN